MAVAIRYKGDRENKQNSQILKHIFKRMYLIPNKSYKLEGFMGVRGSTFDPHVLFSSDNGLFLYLVFKATTDDKPFPHKLEVANVNIVFNATVI